MSMFELSQDELLQVSGAAHDEAGEPAEAPEAPEAPEAAEGPEVAEGPDHP